MRKIEIDYVKPGMKLARSVFTSNGSFLLSCGVELSQKHIDRLREKGIFCVYIDGEISQRVELDDVIINNKVRIKAENIVKKVISDIGGNNQISRVQKVTAAVDLIVDELLKNRNVLVDLNEMRLIDEYTFVHCINVCILSVMTGISMGYSQLRLRDLGLGALLHDIGKMRIPIKILKKPGRLTDAEYDEIKRHTILGFDILRNYTGINKVSANTALAHHERCDGTGYPNGLEGDEIHEFSKIVAIADVYDAMTSDRIYRKGVEPSEAVEYLVDMRGSLFDCEVVKVFISNVSAYFTGR